jgi:hypothetical protein
MRDPRFSVSLPQLTFREVNDLCRECCPPSIKLSAITHLLVAVTRLLDSSRGIDPIRVCRSESSAAVDVVQTQLHRSLTCNSPRRRRLIDKGSQQNFDLDLKPQHPVSPVRASTTTQPHDVLDSSAPSRGSNQPNDHSRFICLLFSKLCDSLARRQP